jgi:hypothetical protein
MFSRISNSWELVKASYAVLRSDKELIIFPIVSFIGVIIVTISFAVPMFASGIFQSLAQERITQTGAEAFALVIGFLFYLVMYTVIIFSNTALVGAAMIRLQGGNPTLGDGFRVAFQRITTILGYALISATVGMILRLISERGGLIGTIISSILGFAWSVVTFLVVPILVVENVGPVEAVKRSGSLLKKTWGEQLVGNFSIGTIFGLLGLGVILVGVLLTVVFAATKSVALMALVIGATILAILALSLLSSTLSGIYQAALYRYATEGDTSGYFSGDLIQGAFKSKL